MTATESLPALIRIRPAGAPAAPVCNSGIAEAPWNFDPIANYGPGASLGDFLPADSPRQGVLPELYRKASPAELDLRIRAAKAALGERLVILGHFYQRDEVIQYADFVGDSFQLAQAAKTRPKAEAIVFCGVHFMAETADMLSRPDQAVILPNLAAGCSMADMADLDSVEECWEQVTELLGETTAEGLQQVIPVTYMNSSAALKGFCGRHGGVVCTSSNAKTVLAWAFERGRRVLFFPDQHLGRNTAKAMGIPLDEMPMWDPRKPLGGNTAQAIEGARVLLWHGFCSVHKRFSVEQIAHARAEYPGVRVRIVHPECPMQVVDAADESGSTDYIVKAIAAAPAGTTFAIGTEVNLVQRLAAENPQHTIFCLDPVICPCSTMYRIHPGYLAWVLEAFERGEVLNRITVPESVAVPARVALERMLALKPGTSAIKGKAVDASIQKTSGVDYLVANAKEAQ